MRTKTNVIAISLIVIGVIGFAFTRFDLSLGSEPLITVEKSWEFNEDTLKNLSIVGKSENVEVEFVQSDQEQGIIELVGQFRHNMNEHFDKTVIDNQALTIDVSDKGKQRLIQLTYKEIKTNITVKVPKEMSLDSFDVKVTSGDMKIKDILSKQATLAISSGNITLDKARGEEINISSSSGNIKLDEINANVTVSQKSGNIKISNIVGQLSTELLSGNTTISDVNGALNAKSLSGNITINNVDGALNANSSSGNVKVNQQYNGDVHIDTTSGNVELAIDERFDGYFELRSSSGNIEAPQSIGASSNKVQIKTNSGNIKVKN